MDTYIEEQKWLNEYANRHNLKDLTSEEIMKLIEKPYITSEILDAFHITEKEFQRIRKRAKQFSFRNDD